MAVHRGLYVVSNTELTVNERWHLELHANLRRAGTGSALSHRTAAVLHGLEGITGRPTDITVPWESGYKAKPAIRSRTLTSNDVTTTGGYAVTSVARTLGDLGRFVRADTVEAALNSALRGPNRMRPDIWDEELLEEVRSLCRSRTTRRGIATLRTVLDRRGSVRPTGSYPETVLLIAARRRGVELEPQINVHITSVDQRQPRNFFPDLAVLEVLLDIEIEGVEGHSGAERIDRDARRQNLLSQGFDVLRFQAGRVLADPDGCAAEIQRRVVELRRSPPPQAARVRVVDPWNCILHVA